MKVIGRTRTLVLFELSPHLQLHLKLIIADQNRSVSSYDKYVKVILQTNIFMKGKGNITLRGKTLRSRVGWVGRGT